MHRYISDFPNRTVCSVLEEMRSCVKTANYSYLPGLIEEAQTMVNRMEAGLEDKLDVKNARETIKVLKAEIENLCKKKKDLEK